MRKEGREIGKQEGKKRESTCFLRTSDTGGWGSRRGGSVQFLPFYGFLFFDLVIVLPTKVKRFRNSNTVRCSVNMW